MPVQKGRKWSVDHTVICIHTTKRCIYTLMRHYQADLNFFCVEKTLALELSEDLAQVGRHGQEWREMLDLLISKVLGKEQAVLYHHLRWRFNRMPGLSFIWHHRKYFTLTT